MLMLKGRGFSYVLSMLTLLILELNTNRREIQEYLLKIFSFYLFTNSFSLKNLHNYVLIGSHTRRFTPSFSFPQSYTCLKHTFYFLSNFPCSRPQYLSIYVIVFLRGFSLSGHSQLGLDLKRKG